MKVFRVQDKDGRGPWKPGFSQQWTEDRPDEEYAALVPWTSEFGLEKIIRRSIQGMHIGCGCRTLEQLRRWFTATEYATLQGFGYQAYRIKVGRILGESDIQCVFERAQPLRFGGRRIDLYEKSEPVEDSACAPRVE